MRRLAILAATQIHRLLRHLDAFLRHEHADNARVRPDRIVELHGASLPGYASCLPPMNRPVGHLSNTRYSPLIVRSAERASGAMRSLSGHILRDACCASSSG